MASLFDLYKVVLDGYLLVQMWYTLGGIRNNHVSPTTGILVLLFEAALGITIHLL